ncbi:hypothetical protein [Oceanobacillus senegalensis]|uniref:hypothetical protein n=1 Tax=Oceanobacillus senegalensis TaxID=1936063 RepID=UPI000A30E85C|nr:hypothetical protein [Oceanobacillus senegalensis]
MKQTFAILGILFVGIMFILVSFTKEFETQEKHHPSASTVLDKKDAATQEKELRHEDIISLTKEFMDILIQESGENYKVKGFQTEEQILKELDKITTRQVAEAYVPYYYEEKTDGLYIVPTETPPWFIPKNSYEMKQVSDVQTKITQHNRTELDGDYTIEIEFTHQKNWKITNVIYR